MNQKPESHSPSIPARRPRWQSPAVWALAIALGLLLVVGINLRAPQPTHQGKTAEEWFGEVTSIYSGLEYVTRDPAVIGLRQLGTNAVWFLWQERTRKDLPLLSTLQRQLKALVGGRKHRPSAPHGEAAWQVLFVFGPETEILLPEALELLKRPDPKEAAHAAILLSYIKKQPEVVVPAILQSMAMTNRQLEHRTMHLASLRNLGLQATSAVPALRAHFSNPVVASTYEAHWAAEAILTINGPGPELAYYTNAIRWGNYTSSFSPIVYLSRLGTNARPAAPLLQQFALTLTNQSEILHVSNVVRTIDPEGLLHKP